MPTRFLLFLLFLSPGLLSAQSHVKVGMFQFRERGDRPLNQVVIGQDLVIGEGETNRDVVVILGNVTVKGHIEKDLVVILGRVHLEATGRIGDELLMVGGKLETEPGAAPVRFDGPSLEIPSYLIQGMQEWVRGGLLLGRLLPHDVPWAWWIMGSIFVCNLLIALFLPHPMQKCVDTVANKPVSCFLTGLLTLILIGPLVFLLIASVVGTVAVPFVLCGFLAAFVLGKLAVYRHVGEEMALQLRLTFLRSPLWSLILGMILFFLLFAIPFLGIIAWGLVATFGLGTSVLATFHALKWERPEGSPASIPVLVTESHDNSDPQQAPGYPATSLMSRAGFWVRLAATFFDAVLIGMIVRLFAQSNSENLFLPVFLLYHLIMWSWKSTTVGGMIIGLKIVHLNGIPLSFSAALIRWLAGFFSGLVFFLGFFWVGWTREKQSWHDILAGTIIVNVPKSAPAPVLQAESSSK